MNRLHANWLSLLLAPGVVLSQDLACGGSDYRCLQIEYENVCLSKPFQLESCKAWIQRLGSHENIKNVEWQLMQSEAYAGLSYNAEVPQVERSQHRSTARRLLGKLLEEYPQNAQALLGMATLSDSRDEEMKYLRASVAADPANLFSVNGLVNRLVNTGDTTGVAEAAELLKNTYLSQPVAEKNWNVASRAYALLERAEPEGAAEFKQQVAKDTQIEQLPAILQRMSLPELSKLFEAVCNANVMEMIGPSICSDAVGSAHDKLMSVKDTLEQGELVSFADVIARGIIDGARIYAPGTSDNPIYSSYVAYTRSLVDLDLPSALVLETYANFSTKEAQLDLIERAVELDPDNGPLIYRLGLLFFELEQWPQAIEAFERARPLLETWRHAALDDFVEQARNKIPPV